MHRFLHRLRNLATLAKHLQWKEIGQKIGNRLYSSTRYYGLVNRLADPPDPVEASVATDLRLLRDEDVPALFDINAPGLSHDDVSDRLYEHLLINAGIRHCYVAVTREGRPCAALWLISAADNAKLRNISNGNFPLLENDEMLLEGLFTLNEYRNRHIMAWGITHVLAVARGSGAAKVLAFVHHKNIASLRTLGRTGFVRYVVKRERWFLFFRKLTFEPVPIPPGGERRKETGQDWIPDTVTEGGRGEDGGQAWNLFR